MSNPKFHVDMIFIREKYTDELLSKVPPVRLYRLMDLFLVQGKKCLKEFMNPETGQAFMKLTPSYDITINTGKGLAPTDLTFGRLTCLLGEINRRAFIENGNCLSTSLSKYVKPVEDIQTFFKSFLHHGVHFSWDLEDNNAPVNQYIYLAIKTLDLIFVNIDRAKRNQPFLSRASMLHIIPSDKKTWSLDLIKYIGVDRLSDFEKAHRKLIKQKLELIQFNVADLKSTGKVVYI